MIVRSAYGEDEGLNIIRLGEIERENARTPVGEEVTVEKCDVKEAEKNCCCSNRPEYTN